MMRVRLGIAILFCLTSYVAGQGLGKKLYGTKSFWACDDKNVVEVFSRIDAENPGLNDLLTRAKVAGHCVGMAKGDSFVATNDGVTNFQLRLDKWDTKLWSNCRLSECATDIVPKIDPPGPLGGGAVGAAEAILHKCKGYERSELTKQALMLEIALMGIARMPALTEENENDTVSVYQYKEQPKTFCARVLADWGPDGKIMHAVVAK